MQHQYLLSYLAKIVFIKRNHFFYCVCFFFLLTSLVPIRAAIAGDFNKIQPITFTRFAIDPEGQYDFQIVPDALRPTVIGELKKHNYNVTDTTSTLFNQVGSHDAKFLLGGVINELTCHQQADRRSSACHIAISWELFDHGRNQVVYTVTTRHKQSAPAQQETWISLTSPLVIGALNSLLRREKFNQLLVKLPPTEEQTAFSTAHFKACVVESLSLPGDTQQALSASVMVKSEQTKGSGIFISNDGLVITANSLLPLSSQPEIITQDGTVHKATVLRRDPDYDLALIKADVENTNCSPLATHDQQPGAEIYAISASIGENHTSTLIRGHLDGIKEWQGHQFIEADASIISEVNSWPLLDMSGNIIGVLSSKIAIPGHEGKRFGVPSELVLSRLALEPGQSTTLALSTMGDAEPTEDVEQYPIIDKDDPAFIEPVPPAYNPPIQNGTGEYRVFYSSGRVTWFVFDMAFLSVGIELMVQSYVEVKLNPNDVDWKTQRIINTVGWITAGLGLGNLVLFLATGTRDDERPLTAKAIGPVTTSIEFDGNGIRFKGRF